MPDHKMIGNYSIVDNIEVLGQLIHFDSEERTVLRQLTSYQIPYIQQSLNVVPNSRMYCLRALDIVSVTQEEL